MNLFDHLLEVVVEHPVIGGSFGAFIAAVIAALLNQSGLAVLLVVVGVILAVVQIFVSNR